MYSFYHSLTLVPVLGEWLPPHCSRSTPGKGPSTPCIGGWKGPRAGLDEYGKSHPPQGFCLRSVQPVVSCYNDHTVLVPQHMIC